MSQLTKPHIMLPSCLCGVFKHNYKIHIIAICMSQLIYVVK